MSELRQNLKLTNIKARRGRPKGSKKPFSVFPKSNNLKPKSHKIKKNFSKKRDCDSNVHVQEPSAKRTKYAKTKVKNHNPWIVELDLRMAEKETLSVVG